MGVWILFGYVAGKKATDLFNHWYFLKHTHQEKKKKNFIMLSKVPIEERRDGGLFGPLMGTLIRDEAYEREYL